LESNNTTLALCGDSIVTPGGVRSGAILIRDGGIVDVVGERDIPESCRREAYPGKVLMPGLVDTHVHINEPGRTEWEGFESATRAAVAGGITTIVDMPLNSSPVTTTIDNFLQKISASKDKLFVDCGFHGGLVPGNTSELQKLIDAGVLGIKAFLVHSGIDEFPNVKESDLVAAMPLIAEAGIPLLVHAELDVDATLSSTRRYSDYLSSRPRSMEQQAIELMIRLCREYDCRVHIVHLSSADAVPALRAAREEGIPITVETCPHYLFFASENVQNGDTRFKCAPPIREEENRERLWDGLEDGVIDFIASDHSPCPPDMKGPEGGDFSKAWGGISSLQFGLSIVWTGARQRGHTVSDIAEWMCRQPAKLIGMEGRKGSIAPGCDADIVVWDPEGSFTVDPAMIHHRHKLTPYEGCTLFGKVHATFLRGRKVYDDGKFFGPYGATLLRIQHERSAAWSS